MVTGRPYAESKCRSCLRAQNSHVTSHAKGVAVSYSVLTMSLAIGALRIAPPFIHSSHMPHHTDRRKSLSSPRRIARIRSPEVPINFQSDYYNFSARARSLESLTFLFSISLYSPYFITVLRNRLFSSLHSTPYRDFSLSSF